MTDIAMALMGLDDQAQKQARKGLKKLDVFFEGMDRTLPNSQKKQLVLDKIAKMPPEVLAHLFIHTLASISTVALSLSVAGQGLDSSMGESRGHTARLRMAQAFDETVEELREIAHRIKEGLAVRIAEGFPEWDYDLGCSKGQNDGPPAMTNEELESLFAGLNFGEDW